MVTKLTIEYDGSGFAGWARQPGKRTVQGEIERVLGMVLRDPIMLTVAGRTDRGVHAWGQVASYRHDPVEPARLNGLLDADITVLACEPASEGFDARRDALSRTYCYRVLNRRSRSVFCRTSALWWPRELDLQALNECASKLIGTHDFTAFTPTETEHRRFQRNVLRAEWVSASRRLGGDAHVEDRAGRTAGELLEFWIEADTFMRHMNRVLVGTMLEVAAGRRGVDDFTRLLTGRPRREGGPTAPPHGLALASVSYAS